MGAGTKENLRPSASAMIRSSPSWINPVAGWPVSVWHPLTATERPQDCPGRPGHRAAQRRVGMALCLGARGVRNRTGRPDVVMHHCQGAGCARGSADRWRHGPADRVVPWSPCGIGWRRQRCALRLAAGDPGRTPDRRGACACHRGAEVTRGGRAIRLAQRVYIKTEREVARKRVKNSAGMCC